MHFGRRGRPVPPNSHLSESWRANPGGVCLSVSTRRGIGINVGGGAVVGTADQFTLLDQAGAARTPQDSQQFGGVAQPIDAVTPSANGDGSSVATGEATLATLNAGWTSV